MTIRGIMQKTLHHNKANPTPTPIARVQTNTASSLNDEMEELEKTVVESIGRLKAAVKDGEAVVAEEGEHTQQVIESLRANIAVLEAKVTETEETVRRIDSASQSMEKSLTGKIATLAVQLSDAEKIVREKESTIKAREQDFAAKIQDLETQLRNNQKLLANRDTQINNLTAQLQALTNGIKGMSSFFRKAEALAVVEAQGISPSAAGEQSQGGEEKPATSQSTTPPVTFHATDAAQETVRPNFFADMTRELSEFFGPIARIIVRDDVAFLGESMGQFPKARVAELVDLVSREIPDENLKSSFRKRFTQNL
jgi:peptidoglycan hydrolase CwlO-like protein